MQPVVRRVLALVCAAIGVCRLAGPALAEFAPRTIGSDLVRSLLGVFEIVCALLLSARTSHVPVGLAYGAVHAILALSGAGRVGGAEAVALAVFVFTLSLSREREWNSYDSLGRAAGAACLAVAPAANG